MAGYSKTPLAKKLGLKPRMRAIFPGAPQYYAQLLGPVIDEVIVLSRMGRDMDFIQLFCDRQGELVKRLPSSKRALHNGGILWICWPKKASGLQTDLGEAQVRSAGLAAGLVDIKVCAVDDTWSGLKFMYRLRDR